MAISFASKMQKLAISFASKMQKLTTFQDIGNNINQ
jgi:hypothetical protein